jgi:hypothetical protein
VGVGMGEEGREAGRRVLTIVEARRRRGTRGMGSRLVAMRFSSSCTFRQFVSPGRDEEGRTAPGVPLSIPLSSASLTFK